MLVSCELQPNYEPFLLGSQSMVVMSQALLNSSKYEKIIHLMTLIEKKKRKGKHS